MSRDKLVIIFIINIMALFAFSIMFRVDAVEFKVYKDTKNMYKLHHPSGWKVKRISSSMLDISKDRETAVEIRIYSNKNRSFNSFVDWYVDDYIEGMEDHWSGKMKIVEKKHTWLGKYKGFVISFDFSRGDNRRWFFKQYLWPQADKVYVLLSWTPYKLRLLNEPVFDSIAESFELSK